MHSQPNMRLQVSRYQRHSHRAKRQAGNNYALAIPRLAPNNGTLAKLKSLEGPHPLTSRSFFAACSTPLRMKPTVPPNKSNRAPSSIAGLN